MIHITPEIMRSLVTQPTTGAVADAIGSCIVSSTAQIIEANAKLKNQYSRYARGLSLLEIDYSDLAIIDAYSVYYLPRNLLVPKMGLLCCTHHPLFRDLPDRLSILDLGSGTGGVILGLLDIFSKEPLSDICLDLVAIDGSNISLKRQKEMVMRVGLGKSFYKSYAADLSDPSSYKCLLALGAPYDIVFAANLFSELPQNSPTDLINYVAHLLSDNGVIINVESQSNPAKKQRPRIVSVAKSSGLHIFYPCPPQLNCPKKQCWNWREDEFLCSPIFVDGNSLETTKIHKAHWTIFSRTPATVYDILHEEYPGLVWGVAAPTTSKIADGTIQRGYEFCTEDGWKSGTITQETSSVLVDEHPLRRGSIIGLDTRTNSIAQGWDILLGFHSL